MRSILLYSLFASNILFGQELETLPEFDAVADAQRCTFSNQPDEYLRQELRARTDAYERVLRYAGKPKQQLTPRAAAALPVANFIDEAILGKMERLGVRPAPLSSDEEFLRRVTLDLAGRTPSVAEVRNFLADSSADKRARVVDRLLFSPEFVDKWTMWLGDLLQNARVAQNRSQQVEGRNRMYEWIRAAVDTGKSYRDIVFELVAGTGNNYDASGVGANFIIRGFHPMGPAQDTYDMLWNRTATMFLGMGHYDCILCHDGRGHLNMVSAWGTQARRTDAQRLAAFFSRVQMTPYRTADTTDFYINSFTVTDAARGAYQLNTNSGNRPRRAAVQEGNRTLTELSPVYRDGRVPDSNAWRESLARLMQDDPMFARNFANRVWKAMFTLALAEPVDFLDPMRLDPAVQPPEGWGFQASHPELLERLALWVKDNDYNLRETLRLIALSSAYQLSSHYEGDWKFEYISLFARRLPRRLDAEEVVDAVLRATQTSVAFLPSGYSEPVRWAMQLPDPTEPRNAGAWGPFMNSFLRGNRDSQLRSRDGSILMYLNLMNSTEISNRIRTGSSPAMLAWSRNLVNEQVVEELFLAFLSRLPDEAEKRIALRSLEGRRTPAERNAALEDLAWVLINKPDFIFSY